MRVITPLDLRRQLGHYLDAASAGQRFVVERDHKPVAVLVSLEDARRLDEDEAERRARARAALDRLFARGAAWRAAHPDAIDPVTAVRLDRDRDEPGAPPGA